MLVRSKRLYRYFIIMGKDLTAQEVQQVREHLKQEHEYGQKSASSSKSGFLNWLKNTALGTLVSKIIEWTWSAIQAAFFTV